MRRLAPALAALGCALALAACSESPRPSLSIVAGGDCLFDRPAGRPGSAGSLLRREPPLAAAPLEPRLLGIGAASRGSDAFLFNLETTIGSGGSPKDKSFVFRSPASALESLRDLPRPIAALANNHSMDYGVEGLLSTIEALDAAGIARAGAGRNAAEALVPARLVVDGASVSVFSCGVDDDPASFAGESRPGIAPIETASLARRVEAARGASDAVVVMLHWGIEYETAYAPWERRIAHALVDAGADLVVGAGPHVTRGIEKYRGSLICYSLGNLLFDDLGDARASTGLLVRMRLSKSDDRAARKRYEIAPLVTRSVAEGPRAPTLEVAERIVEALAARSPEPRALALSAPTRQFGILWYEVERGAPRRDPVGY